MRTATRTVSPSRSSGTGLSCSPSSPRPARGRSNRRAQVGQISVPPLRSPWSSAPPHPAQRLRYASRSPATLAISERPGGGDPLRAPRSTSSACQPLTGPPPPAIGSSKVPIAGGAGGSTTPSTSIPSRSGAVARRACSTASSSVDADAAQPWHDPSSRSFATPSSIPSSSTLPPCDSMYGRTLSSASCTRSSSGTG